MTRRKLAGWGAVAAIVAAGVFVGPRVVNGQATATVQAYHHGAFLWRDFDPAQTLEKSGAPSAAQIADLAAGTLQWMKFTSGNAKFVAACDSFVACADAIEFGCTFLEFDVVIVRNDRLACEGRCSGGVDIVVGCQ